MTTTDPAGGRSSSPGAQPSSHPAWMSRVASEIAAGEHDYFRMFAPPARVHRRSAVLMLFGPTVTTGGTPGEGRHGIPDPTDDEVGDTAVVLTQRAAGMRSHPGQVAFPGGMLDPDDAGPVEAALREAQEEAGIDPSGVEVVLTLPELYLSPSGNSVTPVLAWWPRPQPVVAGDPLEVARAAQVPLSELLDPAHRFTASYATYAGPAFDAGGLYVWGFTAKLLDTLFEVAGLTRAWDEGRTRPLPPDIVADWERRQRS